LFTRRQLIRVAGASAGLAVAPGIVHALASVQKWRQFPFTLGVASGALSSDGFVIWTRLAPEPLSMDPALVGGLSGGDIPIRFEIAEDEAMRRVVQAGTAIAEASHAYSVHHLVSGLKPGRPYWYRFTSGDATSRVGRAMSLPAAGASLDKLRVGYVSCSQRIATSRRSCQMSCSASAITFTSMWTGPRRTSCDGTAVAQSRLTCRVIAIAMRSIDSTMTCSGCTQLRLR
jgi:phosphodiesterase/alkaline phosphatase D-like protein